MAELTLDENVLKQILIQQSKLMEQTNKLLENQNLLLKKNLTNSPPPLE